MKKIQIFTTILLLLLLDNNAFAQFKEGQSFVAGNFFNYLNTFKSKNPNAGVDHYTHNLGFSFGKFTKDNRAAGWGITQSLIIENYDNMSVDPRALRELGFGMERFWEFYKPILADKIALYARPILGLSYTHNGAWEQLDGALSLEKRTNTVMLGVSLAVGLAWRVTPRWALYGSFAFYNPANVAYSFGDTENYLAQNPGGENVVDKTSGFKYSLSPELSAGTVGLGFRYIYGGK